MKTTLDYLPDFKKKICESCYEICTHSCVIFRDAERIEKEAQEKEKKKEASA